MPIPTDDLADSQEYSGGAYFDCQVINSEHRFYQKIENQVKSIKIEKVGSYAVPNFFNK